LRSSGNWDAKQTIDFLEGLKTLRPSFDEIAEAIEPPRG
jgi:hypothetical protein